jgi:Phosphofructokinase
VDLNVWFVTCDVVKHTPRPLQGLNAVIRAVVKAAIRKYKWKVIGIPDGFDGLIWPERDLKSRAR